MLHSLLPSAEPALRQQVANAARVQSWPLSWSLDSLAEVRAAVELLMPGNWTVEEVRMLTQTASAPLWRVRGFKAAERRLGMRRQG